MFAFLYKRIFDLNIRGEKGLGIYERREYIAVNNKFDIQIQNSGIFCAKCFCVVSYLGFVYNFLIVCIVKHITHDSLKAKAVR